MTIFDGIYVACWLTACVIALGLFLAEPNAYAFTHARYWRFLGRPWKLVTFAIATAGLVLVAPYTGDPTWDYFDAGFMAALTFATAPWAVGTLYKGLRGGGAARQLFVALCVWLFSASWSYDLYLLIRDGYYPVTWWANLVASSLLYLCAGLFWNLDWRAGTGVTFAFMNVDWPPASSAVPFHRIAWPAFALMLLVGALVGSFALLAP